MGSYFLFCIGNRAKPENVGQRQLPIVPIVRPRTAVRTIVPIAAEYDAPALTLQSRRAYRVNRGCFVSQITQDRRYTYIVIFLYSPAQPLCRGSARSGIGLVPLYPYRAYAIALYPCTAWLGNRAKPANEGQSQLPRVPTERPRTAVRTLVPIAAEYDACLRV